jgi:exonuclease III
LDPARVLFWNVRGLNSVPRQDAVRSLVQSLNLDVVCLQESKMSSCSRGLIPSMLSVDFDNNFVTLPAVGASGGIIVAWRASLGNIQASRIDTYSASIQFKPINGEAWWITCVYGPQGNDEKIAFLQELRVFWVQCAAPWLLGGDFNLIYKDEDKNNTNYIRAMMGRFRRLIDDLAIKEVPLHGRKYTWSSSVSGASPVLVRLDRVFCSVD